MGLEISCGQFWKKLLYCERMFDIEKRVTRCYHGGLAW